MGALRQWAQSYGISLDDVMDMVDDALTEDNNKAELAEEMKEAEEEAKQQLLDIQASQEFSGFGMPSRGWDGVDVE